ncbi:MAG TPA: hypothetical protein VIX84_12040 [Acidimicrobiales bacterium]
MNDRLGEGHEQWRSMRRTRWLLVGLSGLLVVVLIASGAVVIGAIVAVMAAVRAVMLLRWQPRNGAFPHARPGDRWPGVV